MCSISKDEISCFGTQFQVTLLDCCPMVWKTELQVLSGMLHLTEVLCFISFLLVSWECPISTVHFDLLFSCSLSLWTRALNYCIPVTSKIRNNAMYILASQSIQWQGQRKRMMIGRSLLFKKGNRYLPC